MKFKVKAPFKYSFSNLCQKILKKDEIIVIENDVISKGLLSENLIEKVIMGKPDHNEKIKDDKRK